MSRHKLRSARVVHVCATLLIQSHDLQQALKVVEAHFERSDGSRICVSTFVRYDETPMKLVTVDSDDLWGLLAELFDTWAIAKEA